MSGAPGRVTIGGIERTTALVGATGAAAAYLIISPRFALGCAIGSGFMLVNMMLLAAVGKGITALAASQGGVSRLALLLIPLKLAFFLGATYLIVCRFHFDIPGFVAGVLTQFAAIFIEVWRCARPVTERTDAIAEEGKA